MDYLERFRRAIGEEPEKNEDKDYSREQAKELGEELRSAAVVALTYGEVTWFRNEPKARVGLFYVNGNYVTILSVGGREHGHFSVVPLIWSLEYAEDDNRGTPELVPLVKKAIQHAEEHPDG